MYAEIISVTENSAILAFSTGKAGFTVWKPDNLPEVRSIEATDCGRLYLENLLPDTEYTGVFEADGKSVRLSFRTLTAMKSEELDRIFMIADPHISCRKENRKGRFFVESAMLAEEALREASRLRADAIVIPGDLTDSGSEDEYRLAAEVLKSARIPVYAIPGNHDKLAGGGWERFIGERTFRAELPGGVILGIDTHDCMLHPEDAARIEQELDRNGKLFIVSHYQLFESPDINHAKKFSLMNTGDYTELFERLKASGSVIWCGHQNICSRVRYDRLEQVNFPQVPQWPCGSVLIQRCRGENRYQFIPIQSEILRQWSRTACRMAAEFYGERQWQPEYRSGSYQRSNFIQYTGA